MKKKFKKSIKGAMEYYESINIYLDRMALRDEFELETNNSFHTASYEEKLYKWIRDNKL